VAAHEQQRGLISNLPTDIAAGYLAQQGAALPGPIT
jgi:hypothetical protein